VVRKRQRYARGGLFHVVKMKRVVQVFELRIEKVPACRCIGKMPGGKDALQLLAPRAAQPVELGLAPGFRLAWLPAAGRDSLLSVIFTLQRPDGGWCLTGLGAWERMDSTPLEQRSDGYATGLIVLVLKEIGADSKADPHIARGIDSRLAACADCHIWDAGVARAATTTASRLTA